MAYLLYKRCCQKILLCLTLAHPLAPVFHDHPSVSCRQCGKNSQRIPYIQQQADDGHISVTARARCAAAQWKGGDDTHSRRGRNSDQMRAGNVDCVEETARTGAGRGRGRNRTKMQPRATRETSPMSSPFPAKCALVQWPGCRSPPTNAHSTTTTNATRFVALKKMVQSFVPACPKNKNSFTYLKVKSLTLCLVQQSRPVVDGLLASDHQASII